MLEKAAANISVVAGVLTPERAKAMSRRGRAAIDPASGQSYSGGSRTQRGAVQQPIARAGPECRGLTGGVGSSCSVADLAVMCSRPWCSRGHEPGVPQRTPLHPHPAS